MKDINSASLDAHKRWGGKLRLQVAAPLRTRRDLALAYTPGVGAVSRAIAAHPKKVYDYTIKKNTVAVITDGSAVLGLGNLGPAAALPVMEGKAALFKRFADIDAFPICLDTQDTEEIIRTVQYIAPVFGGINLEDISAPRCFEIERRLIDLLPIPVLHDDQQGTAVVALAALTNALRVTRKRLADVRIVINGAGAAGHATAQMLLSVGVQHLVVCDSKGVISLRRTNLGVEKKKLAKQTHPESRLRTLADALEDAHVFIGVSVAGVLTPAMVRSMAPKPVIIAMANPTPEIMPDQALAAGAFIVATGRSDFPNQINNVLAFPGIFRGALDHGVRKITPAMLRRAALNIAKCVSRPDPQHIVPDVFDPRVVRAVAAAIK